MIAGHFAFAAAVRAKERSASLRALMHRPDLPLVPWGGPVPGSGLITLALNALGY